MGVWSIGLLGARTFRTDPVSGYLPRTPDRLSEYNWHGALHDLFSSSTFVALAAAYFVFGRRSPLGVHGWATYTVVTGVVFGDAFIPSSAGFGRTEGLVELAGLLQPVSVIAGFGWLTLSPFSN